MNIIVKSPSVWMLHVPGSSQHPSQWINLALVRSIEHHDQELIIWFDDDNFISFSDSSVVCAILDELRLLTREYLANR